MKKIFRLGPFFTVLFILAAGAEAQEYTLTVNFTDFTLSLTRSGDQLIALFPVALPKFMPKNLPAEGEVVRIECPAAWYPTATTRRDFLTKRKIYLPEYIGPGDPRNAMGAAKIIIAFFTPGVDPACRIHGTNDPASIGRRVSRWCIRMHDRDILRVREVITGKKTKVLFVRS